MEEEKDKKEEGGQESSIRTYAGDVSGLIKKGMTVSDIALSEQKRKIEKEPEKKEVKDGRKMISISVFFILLGLLVIAFTFYLGRNDEGLVNNQQSLSEIIYTNNQLELPIGGLDRIDILKRINQERVSVSGPLGSVTNLYFTLDRKELSGGQFLEKIEVRAKQSFIRSLGERYLFGVHSFDGNHGFFIFEVDFFENALSGMFDWEKILFDDLWPILFTSKPDTTSEEIALAKFEDMVIKNRDTRVLRDNTGKIVLIYSFPDKNHLIITSSERTLIEAFDRLTSSRLRN